MPSAVTRLVAGAAKPFPLGGLKKADIAVVRGAVARIRERLNRQRSDIIEIGQDLLRVKDKLEHGQFERWLDHEFELSVRAAQLYMRAAAWVASLPQEKYETVSQLPPATLYRISAPSTPDTARQQVIEHIEKHGRVEPQRVKMIVNQAKALKPRRRKVRPVLSATAARRRERKLAKEETARQQREAANVALARELAEMLARRLAAEEMELLLNALDNWAGRLYLREEIEKTHQAKEVAP